MRLGLIWFSFKRDALSVVESVIAAKKLYKEEPCIVVNDSIHSIPQLQLDILTELGCTLIHSSYNRGGNLWGRKCLLGQLSTMIEVGEAHGLTHLLKIDSDTVVLSKEWVKPHDLLGFSYSHFWDRTNIYGLCYVLSIKASQQILSHLKGNLKLGKGGEDALITEYARELGLDVVPIEVTPDRLLAISYRWQDPDFDYSQCYAVTVGQGRQGKRCDDIELEAYAMAKLAKN